MSVLETIAAQIGQLQFRCAARSYGAPPGTAGARRSTPASSSIDVPKAGRFIFSSPNGDRQTSTRFSPAVAENQLPEILGARDGGMGAPDKSQLQRPVSVVVAKDGRGTTVQATATDAANLARTIEQTRKLGRLRAVRFR